MGNRYRRILALTALGAASALVFFGLQREVDRELPTRVAFVDVEGLRQARALAREIGVLQGPRVHDTRGTQRSIGGRGPVAARPRGTPGAREATEQPRAAPRPRAARALPKLTSVFDAAALLSAGYAPQDVDRAAELEAKRAEPLDIRRVETPSGPVYEIRQ